jgi:hypothetical protein
VRCRLVDSLLLHTHNNNIKSQKENSRLCFFSFFFFFLDFFVPLKRIEQVYKEGWLLFLHPLKDIHTIVYSRKDIMDEISPPLSFYIILSQKKKTLLRELPIVQEITHSSGTQTKAKQQQQRKKNPRRETEIYIL